jgi:Protein of unknown function (DUF3592)
VERVLVFGVVMAGVGALASFAGLHLWRCHRRVLASMTITTGRVVEIVESDVDGQQMFQPVVEFTADGTAHHAHDQAFHGARAWQIGDPHVVYYDPRSPSTNLLSRETGSLFGATLIGTFGVVFTVIGAIALAAYVSGADSALGRFVASALS